MGMASLGMLYQRELRTTLRERNVLLYVVVVPLILYPFLIWLAMSGLSVLTAEAERSAVRVTISPPQPTLSRALQRHSIQTVSSPDPREELRLGRLDAWIEVDGEKHIKLHYDGKFRQSQRAQQRLWPLLQSYRDVRLEQVALERGVPLADLQPMLYDDQNEGSSRELGQYVLGTFLPLCLLLVLSLGGLYPAVETMAGEHERQTLDTTLCLSVPRWQIVVSKYLLVVSLSCLSGVCNLVALTVSLRSILEPLDKRFASQVDFGWTPFTASLVLLGIVLMSMLIGAATMLCTAHARSFREGQAATSPLFMSILLPVGVLVDRGLTLDSHTCWVPVVNVALLWRDSLSGHVSPVLVAATLVFSLFWVVLCLVLLSWRLQRQSRALGISDGSPKR